MGIFGGKPEKHDVPVDQVRTMRSQGIDNNRIIQTLQRDGYSSSQIFEAMNQSDRVPAVSESSPQDINYELNNGEMPSQQQSPLMSDSPPSQQSTSPISQPDYSEPGNFKHPREPMSNIPSFASAPNTAEVEEMVESIIEEKWEDIVNDITKVVEWKNATEARVDSLEHDVNSLRSEFDKLHQAIIGKIGEYDKNILNVGAEVKAMEKVFSKVLPVFTEKVNQLSEVSDSLKKKSFK